MTTALDRQRISAALQAKAETAPPTLAAWLRHKARQALLDHHPLHLEPVWRLPQ